MFYEKPFLRRKNIQYITQCYIKNHLYLKRVEHPSKKSSYNFMLVLSNSGSAMIFLNARKMANLMSQLQEVGQKDVSL